MYSFYKASLIVLLVVLAFAVLTSADICQPHMAACTVSEKCCKPMTCHGFRLGFCA